MRKTILIISRCNTDNFGDRMIGHTMMQLFSDVGDVVPADFTFRMGKEERALPKPLRKAARIRTAAKLLKQADCIILGGGELISDNPQFSRCLRIWSRLIRLAAAGTPAYVFGCGVTGQFKAGDMLADTLRVFRRIYVRDPASAELLCAAGCETGTVRTIPDCVFAFSDNASADEPAGDALLGVTDLSRYQKHRKLGIRSEQELLDFYSGEIAACAKHGDPVTLIYNTRNDRITAERVFERFQSEYPMLQMAQINDEYDLCRHIRRAKYVRSPRMHTLILSLVYGVDCEPIPISEKISHFRELYLPVAPATVPNARTAVLAAADEIKGEILK